MGGTRKSEGYLSYFRAAICLFLVATNVAQVTAVQSLAQGRVDTAVNLAAGSVTLHCVVAEQSGEVFWQIAGNLILATTDRSLPTYPRHQIVGDPSQGEQNLQISDVRLEDDGFYQCQVTPGAADEPNLRSTPARLTVRRPPMSLSVSDAPQKTVSVDKPANLTCTALGANPFVSITWLRDGTPLEGALVSRSPSSDPSGKLWDTESVLTFTPAIADRGATYQCQAINDAIVQPMAASLTLDVQHPPVILVETIPAELREGQTITVRCVVDANPPGVLYQWSKNGEPVPGDTDQYEMTLEKGDNQAVIVCTAANAMGTNEGSLTLDVKYGPRFVDIPGETAVDEGELAQLQCSADGNPAATIKWSRIGSRATLSTMQQLQFDSVRESDVGVYICEARVEGFEPIMSYGQVDINSVPVIEYAEKQEARPGSTARLECITESRPVPDQIIWSWGDMELDEGSSGRFSVAQEVRKTSNAGVLTIREVRSSDFREYNCTIVNGMGASEAIIMLEPKGMDLLFYIIIAVVTMALVIFVLSIIFMVYCKRKLQQKRAAAAKAGDDDDDDAKKVKVEIIRKLSDLHLSDEERRKLAGAFETPRYAEPFIPRRRDSWEDPTYRPLSAGSRTPPSYGEDAAMDRRRYSSPSSHEYMDAGDGPYRGRRMSDIPDRDPSYDGGFDEPPPQSNAPDRGSYYDDSPGNSAPPSRASERNSQYEGTLRRDSARMSGVPSQDPRRESSHEAEPAPDRHGDQYPRRYSDNRGYGYFEEPTRRDPSRQTDSLVRRDDRNRRSDLSMNSRNKLATNV